ncbi:Heat shock protein DnaJ, N-terminal with domain of unknown function (DUF1977), putative [Theobroma cacao]|uniref:DUF1977 domain-containing protein n=1 Tax=Theobroma cacao TaxID=3641 RepID=A0A061GND5_THECC|nr:Heat shock protein DnaJ, N-terminal with domain of unknown function (DUF1977), putative [Theobroma cacao]
MIINIWKADFSFKEMPFATFRFLSFSICVLIQSLLALLILILLLNILPSSEHLYSLSRSYPYEYKMKTQKGVSYYVESTKFEQKYPANNPDRVRFEDRVNFFPSSEPVYSVSRSYPYEYKFTTQKGVNYYVRSTKFEQDYPLNSPERIKIEERVERDYYSVLAQNCRFELQRQQWGFIRETPHCDLLQKFQSAA